MEIIKLDATDSTNTYLKNLLLTGHVADFTVVVAKKQWVGRGQMGTQWDSEPGKNLTFSILKRHKNLATLEQFGITMVASLGILQALQAFQVPDLSIKWPNDILSGRYKICGILIENHTTGKNIQTSILGIGLNVNQEDFGQLPNVSSLKLLLGKSLEPDEILQEVLDRIRLLFTELQQGQGIQLRERYTNHLFRRGKPSTFINGEGEQFMGFIRGVSDAGRLLIALEGNTLREFDLKEVQLLY